MGAVNEVTDATFADVVLKSDKPVLVDYWADWCGPCKQVAPIIEELANTHGDKVTFVKMDTNTNPVTPANNHVLGLPTIQVYVGGELVKAFKGAKPKSVLLKAIEEDLDLTDHMEDAVKSLKIVIAADRSIHEGQVISL